MYELIRDFLLEPALYTVGMLTVPVAALTCLMVWLRRRDASAARPTGPLRALASVAVGELLTLVAILVVFSAAVLTGRENLRYLAWAVVVGAWVLAWGLVGRLGAHAFWAGGLTGVVAWLVDSELTERILFE